MRRSPPLVPFEFLKLLRPARPRQKFENRAQQYEAHRHEHDASYVPRRRNSAQSSHRFRMAAQPRRTAIRVCAPSTARCRCQGAVGYLCRAGTCRQRARHVPKRTRVTLTLIGIGALAAGTTRERDARSRIGSSTQSAIQGRPRPTIPSTSLSSNAFSSAAPLAVLSNTHQASTVGGTECSAFLSPRR
jgi:hypothetical protein